MKKSLQFPLGIIAAFLFIIINISANAQQITVGTGTYTSYSSPARYNYNYSWSQSIYLSSEINKSGSITKIAYKVSNNPSTATNTLTNQKIYFYETTSTSVVSGYQSPVSMGATLVYSGSITYVNGWVEVVLPSAYYYSGNNNLLICFESRQGTAISSIPYFNVSYTSTAKCKYYYSSSSASAFGNTGYTNNYRPNVRLNFQVAQNDLALEQWFYPTQGSTASATMPIMLKVKNVGTAAQSNYTVKYSIDNGANWTSQTVATSLASNSSNTVNFFSGLSADMSSAGLYQCIGVVRNTGDTLTYNDTVKQNITICGGAYSGSYTIGSDTSSDFPDIEAAIASVETCGLSGPVTFRIKNGVRTKQIHIRPISGTSATNHITFESYSGNAADVVYQYSATATNDNYVLRFDTASYITFKNITFKALNSTYGGVIYEHHSSHITLDGNRIIGSELTAGVSNYNVLLFCVNSSYTNTSTNIIIKNNYFKYGSYAIQFNGASTTYPISNIEIENNDIENYLGYGIYLYNSGNYDIKKNKIATSKSNSFGIYVNYGTGLQEVSQNKINIVDRTGIEIRYSSGTSANPIKVNNNFIYQSSQNQYSANFYNNHYVNFDFNSIHSKGTNSLGNLSISSGSNYKIRNNNIINNAGGYPLYVGTTTAVLISDYNNYYTSGSNLAYWNGFRTSLSALKTASGKETHSLNNNITFYSDDNLHVSGSSLNNLGIPVAGITKDFDGQIRSTTTPDIGADEFSIYPNDAGLLSFQNLTSICPGTAQSITLNLKNFGYSALTNVKFGMSINGNPQPTTDWNGLLGALNSVNTTIGSYTFDSDSTYEIKAWVDSVNSTIDSNAYNDTIVLSNYHTSFSGGTYQIGSSSSADFIDISTAIDAMNLYGICGPIVFNIENGTYAGQYSIGNISGSNSTNSVTFQSLSGDSSDVKLVYNSLNYNYSYIFLLSGASHVSFKNLTFEPTSLYYSGVFKIINSSHHIEIDACNLKGISVSNYSDYNALINTLESEQITVKNSTLNEGAYGIYCKGLSNSSGLDNIKLINNSITNFYRYGAYFYYMGDSIEIIGNTFKDKLNSSGSSAIYEYAASGKTTIANNMITMIALQNTSAIYAYRHNYYSTNSTKTLNIFNNFILVNTTSSTRPIYLYYARYSNIYYNTIKVLNGSTSSTYALYAYYSNYNNIKNNSFDVGTQNLMFFYSSSISSSDYNNFFSDNTSPIYYNNSNRTIAYYKSISGLDSHSKNVDPNYVGTDDLHLHDITLNNAGIPLAGITDDIDGDIRSTSNPDIGADEYVMLANDAQLYAINNPTDITATGSTPIKVAIRNMGTSNLITDSIHYQINSGAVVSIKWTGNLAPLAIDSFILTGTETFTAGNYTIKAFSTSPNNTTDLNNSNDTLQKSFVVQVMPSITINPTTLVGTINTCNDSITVPLKIINNGGATLTGTIDSIYNATSLKVVILRYGVSSTYVNNLVAALDETFTNYTLSYTYANNVTTLQNDIAGKDVIIMPYMSSSSYQSTYITFASTFQNFVSNGGTMVFSGQYSGNFSYVTNTGLWNGSTYSGYSSSKTINVMSHDITNGINATNINNLSESFFYFTGTPSNYTSLIKYGSYNVAGMRTYGSGHVVYLGYRYYYANQTAAEILASNTLKYVFEQNPNWVKLSSNTFSILPNDSTIINVEMNGVGNLNGTYNYDLKLHSNDLGNPNITIPCVMTIAGPPSISSTSSAINFGGTYINMPSYDSLMVFNDGCGDLIITNINSSNSAFTTLTTTDTIAPGDSTQIVYKFLTSTAGAYAATSVIFNNDTNYTISLAANATNPPVMTATPNPMIVTVTNCNDSVNANLQIQNTGGGTLTSTVEEMKDSVEIIILTYGTYSSYLNNLKNSLNYTFSKFNYTELNTINATTLQNQINTQDADVIIIPFVNGSSYSANYSNLSTTLQSFVSGGGTVIFAGIYYSNIFTATGLISGSRYGSTSYKTLTTQNTNDPITLNFASTYSSGTDDFYYYTFTSSNITSLVKYGSYEYAVRRAYGSGNVIVIGSVYNDVYTANTKAILSNSIKYVSEQGADWLQFTSSTSNLTGGSSAIKSIKFNANGLATGTYTASIKITTNAPINPIVYVPCTLTVLNQMAVGVNLGSDTTHCGALTLNAGSYTSYAWNTGNTTQTISAVSTGTYSVTVSNGGNCTSSDTIAVTVNPIPSVNLTGLPSTSCTNNTPITLNASPNGGVFAGPGISSNVFSPSSAGIGTHSIFYSYTNIYNCTNSASQQITVYAPPTVSFSGLNASYCPQGTASVLNGVPSGGVFSGSGMVQNTFAPALTTSGNHNIVYTYTDSHNCSNSDTNSTVVTVPGFTVSISGYQNSYCINGSASSLTGTPSGGVFSGNGVSGSTFNPAVAGVGTHYIKYEKQDANSCYISDSIAVSVYALPSGLIISGLSQSFCSNNATVSVTGFPAGGIFTGPGISGTNFYPLNAGAGNHTITYTYTDVNGCTNSTTALAQVDPIPSISFTNLQSQYCENDAAFNITATPSGGILSGDDINNGQFDPLNTGSGTYYVYYEFTDANSCYNKDSFNIIVNAIPTVNITNFPSSFCSNGLAVSLSGTPNGGIFAGNGVSGNNFSPITAGLGSHYVSYTYTDNNGCSNSDSSATMINQVHGVNAGNDASIAYNTSTQLTGLVTGGGTSFTFSWSPSNLVTNSTQLSPATNNLASSTLFTLSVTDVANSCVNSDDVLITVTGGPLTGSAAASPATLCEGESSQLQALGSGGSGTYTYAWSSMPSGFTSTIANPVVSPNVTTLYTCIVSDGSDTSHQHINVIVNPIPQTQIFNLNNSYCNNENVVNLTVSPPGGNLIGNGINGFTFEPANASLGQNMVIYSMTNSNNCYGADTVVVDILNAPTAYAGQDTTLPCLNGGLALGQQPISGITYQWSPNIALSSNTIANPFSNPNLSINYTLMATDNVNACTAFDTVHIVVVGGPTAQASNDTLVCPNSTVSMTATGGDTYLWSTGATTNTISASPSVTTMYYVIVTQSGCADLDTVYVNISDPKPRLGNDTTICASQFITLDAGSGFTSYSWSTGDNSSTITVDSTGVGLNSKTINVQVMDTLSCIGNDTITLTFTDCTGLNDVDDDLFSIRIFPNPSSGKFVIESNETAVKDVQMSIMDANGKLIINKEINNTSGRFNEAIDLSTQAKGVYFIKLSNNNTEKVFKVLIQ